MILRYDSDVSFRRLKPYNLTLGASFKPAVSNPRRAFDIQPWGFLFTGRARIHNDGEICGFDGTIQSALTPDAEKNKLLVRRLKIMGKPHYAS